VHDVCSDKENFTPRAETPRNRNSSPHAVHTDTSSDTSVVTALTEHDRMYSGTAFYAFDNDGVNVLRDRTFLPIPTYDNASTLIRAATASQGAASPISPCPTASSEPISPTRTPPPNRQPIQSTLSHRIRDGSVTSSVSANAWIADFMNQYVADVREDRSRHAVERQRALEIQERQHQLTLEMQLRQQELAMRDKIKTTDMLRRDMQAMANLQVKAAILEQHRRRQQAQ